MGKVSEAGTEGDQAAARHTAAANAHQLRCGCTRPPPRKWRYRRGGAARLLLCNNERGPVTMADQRASFRM